MIFSKDNPKECRLCEYASPILNQPGRVLCSKKGVTEERGSCRKFLYDPLKRKPYRVTLQTDFTADDFSIE